MRKVIKIILLLFYYYFILFYYFIIIKIISGINPRGVHSLKRKERDTEMKEFDRINC